MKKASCWCYDGDPEEIYRWIGDFSKVTNNATYFARIGLALASSDKVCTVKEDRLQQRKPDILSTCKQKYIFSDGAGKCSTAMGDSISSKLGLIIKPVAFQFRLGENKGVITVDPAMEDADLYL